jgi:hypothetical protein
VTDFGEGLGVVGMVALQRGPLEQCGSSLVLVSRVPPIVAPSKVSARLVGR